MMDDIFIFLGLAVAMWFLFGFLWVVFGMEIRMPPAPYHPPLRIKLMGVVTASFFVTWSFITTGFLPKGMAMMTDDMPPDETRKWLGDTCSCPNCRKRRGEI